VVYGAINALQRTPWQVNEDVFVVLDELWNARSGLADLPLQDPLPTPPPPDFLPNEGRSMTKEERAALTEDQRAYFKRWKRQIRDIRKANARARCKVVATSKMLVVAQLMKPHERFYFPHQLDWRGRAYALPLFLNPQGPDLARGLLRFAEAREVGESGGFWLACHGAKCFGVDKVAFDQRRDWVFEHSDAIVNVAQDPLSDLWWTEAGEPWQFLAFCLEWAEFAASGFSPAYRSRLPISMDGSCNGLQHFSAMLRDPEGAAATNLVPAEKPQDIYQRVADRVQERLYDLIEASEDRGRWGQVPDGQVEAVYARQWMDSGLIDRSLVKRQVMTLPYGVTRYGMRDQLDAHCRKEKIDLGKHFEDILPAMVFFTDELLGAIHETVEAAAHAMGWLQECARIANEDLLPLMWTSPSGFPVRQHYPERKSRQVRTLLLGSMRKFSLFEENWKSIERRQMVAGIAPNFVHSLDAAHLMLTVVAAEEEERRSMAWAMVHDSFGTHAGDAETLALTLRQQFVRMYEEHDVLAEFRAQLAPVVSKELPALPEKLSLDIRTTLEADYFFA
jgi:Autographiviridae RNA polymerase